MPQARAMTLLPTDGVTTGASPKAAPAPYPRRNATMGNPWPAPTRPTMATARGSRNATRAIHPQWARLSRC